MVTASYLHNQINEMIVQFLKRIKKFLMLKNKKKKQNKTVLSPYDQGSGDRGVHSQRQVMDKFFQVINLLQVQVNFHIDLKNILPCHLSKNSKERTSKQ